MVKTTALSRVQSVGLVSVTTLALLLAQRGKVFGQDVTKGISEGSVNASGTTQKDTSLFGADGEGGIFRTITNILLFLVGAVSVIMLVIGGVRYVVSGGDQQAVTNAKNTILYAIVGIVVAFLAFAAVNFVTTQLETSTTGGG